MAFFGINVSTQGLFTAKTALDIVNHNISNAETPGYSRQYAVQSASKPIATSRTGMIGTGSEITDIKQYRSEYLDQKYWSMVNDLGQYSIKDELMSQVELLFNEPSDSGFSQHFSDMYDTLQNLTTNPGEEAYRKNFIDAANSFSDYFNNLSENLADYQRDANFGVKICVNEINAIAEQLATVNYQITNSELYGAKANDLSDERNKLIDELSEIINTEVKEIEDVNGKKTLKVTINGQVLVEGSYNNTLELVPRDGYLNNPEDQQDLYDVYWKTGQKLYLANENVTGKLKGYLDVRDGNNGENFKGDVQSVVGTTVVIENCNRNDITSAGKIYLDNNWVKYSSAVYDESTNEMTFTLDSAVPITVTQAKIGDTMDYKGIPYYTMQLNEFVRTIAQRFNEIHKTGNGGTAEELFSYEGYTTGLDETSDYSYNAITINNFAFSEKIADNNDLLATSLTANAGESANDLLLEIANLRHDSEIFEKGEPENYIQALVSEIGIDAKQANSMMVGQENLALMIENQRLSVSSVDVSEETTDMLRFQQAYNLSAKMISIMDEIYDVTINQMVR